MAETESVDNYKPKMSEESFMLFMKRKKAVQELIDTEVAYVRNLELVMNVYIYSPFPFIVIFTL